MRDHRRNQSTSSVSLPGSPKQLARSDSSGMGIRVEPRLTRGTSVLDTVSSRFHDLSSFVSRHVNASVGNRSASPSLLVGSYPQTHQQYRQRSHTANSHYTVAHSGHRAIANQRVARGPWPNEAASFNSFNQMPSYADYHRETLSGDGKATYPGPMYTHDMGPVHGKLPVPYNQLPMDNEEPLRGAAMFNDGRRVLRARFQALDQVVPIPHVDMAAKAKSTDNADWRRRTALLLGYVDGFHIWDVSNINEIREMASIRGHGIGQVMDLQIIPEPSDLPGDQLLNRSNITDKQSQVRPLLAIVSAPAIESSWQETLPPPVFSSDGVDPVKGMNEKSGGDISDQTVLIIYSLKTHQIIRKLTDPRANIMAVSCNRQAIVMSLNDGRIRVVSNHDLSTIATFSDVLITEEHPIPVFSLGSRWIAYACTSPPPPAFAGVARAADTEDTSTMEKVAREVVQGVKSLGSLGYKAMSDYLTSRVNSNESPSSGHLTATSRQRSRRSSSAREIGGVIMVRDLVAEKLHAMQSVFLNESDTSTSPSIPDTKPLTDQFEHKLANAMNDTDDADITTSSSNSSTIKPIVHFRAHEHSCSALVFDPSGFRLVTVSSRGDTFRVHSVAQGRASLLFTLSRGYTHATINDLVFDYESRWLAVSTGHGTTHVFRLPSVEAQQFNIGRHGVSYQGGNWSRRTALTDRAWPPVVRIRQKLDEDMETDDLSDALYSGPVTPSTSYPNGGHRTPHTGGGGGGNGIPLFDVTSVWANGVLGGQMVTEGDSNAHTPPPPLAARFAHFGSERDQAVFIINGAGLLTMHRLKRVKTTELAMETDDMAEWKLLRGDDWDTMMQPIQFTDPIVSSESSKASSSEEEEEEQTVPATNSNPPTKSTITSTPVSEAKWLAHAEIVTYPPNYARVLWDQPGFQFQVFDPSACGDGGDLLATKPVDVNHPLPTPYGWARVEHVGQEASGTNLEECIRKAMQSDMDLSPASRELLDTHNNRGSDPFAQSQRHSPSALMQQHNENDEEIVDMLRKQSPLLRHHHRSPLLTPEDLDHDTLDEFDLYNHDYSGQAISHDHESYRHSHENDLNHSYSSGVVTPAELVVNDVTTPNDDWQDTGHLRIPPINSRGGSIHSLRQSTLSPHVIINGSGDAVSSSSFMSNNSHPTASDVSINTLMDDVREISLSDDDNPRSSNQDTLSESRNQLSQSPNTLGSHILSNIRWFDD